MKKAVFIFITFSAIIPCAGQAQDDSGFIYGKVITHNGNTYIGQIRWGDEEIFWNDIFNSVKTYGNYSTSSKVYQYDLTSENQAKETHKWELLKIWDDTYTGNIHQFTCRFGDLKELAPRENGLTEILLKNEQKIKVNGGSNDIFTDIKIIDYELGPLVISWNNLKKVVFFDSPSVIRNKPGNPLYGKVSTTSGTFEGCIQWDHDERIDTDVLDGYLNGNKLQIEFRDIECINRYGCAALVTHINKKKIQLSGTNDVNCENRGIIVTVEGTGKIEIPWQYFTALCFEKQYKGSGEPYRSYSKPKRLYGKVRMLSGEEEKGIIFFDNDESWDFEHLEGKQNGIKYTIPFRNISIISPKNSNYSNVTLKTGEKLLLGDLRDVSYQNKGILIFKDYEEKPLRFEWSKIDEISFE